MKVLSILVFSFIILYLVTKRKYLLQNSSLNFRIFSKKIVFIVLRNLMSTFRTKMRLNHQQKYVCMCKRFICFLVLIVIIQG
jgi:hypothetical protein